MDLQQFFQENKKVALAFSGGVDSAYLLYAAVKAQAEIGVYYVKSCFQPEFEYEDAKRLARELGVKMTVLTVDVLATEDVKRNPANRCYYCKKQIFGTILQKAKEDGFSVIFDGTNASDDAGDRPGMKVLQEMQVRSPLRECGLTKTRIRELSKEAGLFTHDKPAYACLATRIPAGTEITEELLQHTEKAEEFMMTLGFSDFRVRYYYGQAKLQIHKKDQELFWEKKQEIYDFLQTMYKSVVLDLQWRE